MIEVYTLIAGIVLCLLGIMMLIWTKNFIVLKYEGFQKLIRKKEIEVKYKKVNIFVAILYFVIAIPILTVAIIGFVIEIPDLTYVWIYVVCAGFGLIGSLFANISKQFIQTFDQTSKAD